MAIERQMYNPYTGLLNSFQPWNTSAKCVSLVEKYYLLSKMSDEFFASSFLIWKTLQ